MSLPRFCSWFVLAMITSCLTAFAASPNGQASTAPPASTPTSPVTQASPRGTAEMTFANGKKVTIDYGRPSRNGHPVFGSRVPLDQVWAAGDGLATTITAGQELRLAEGAIQRGKFSLYLLPSQKQWLLVVNQKTGQPAEPYPSNFEFARFKLNHRTLPKPVEQFTISLQRLAPRRGRLTFRWDRTEAWVDFDEGNGKPHIHGEKEEDD